MYIKPVTKEVADAIAEGRQTVIFADGDSSNILRRDVIVFAEGDVINVRAGVRDCECTSVEKLMKLTAGMHNVSREDLEAVAKTTRTGHLRVYFLKDVRRYNEPMNIKEFGLQEAPSVLTKVVL